MARKVVMSKFKFFEVVRVWSFVCCNGEYKPDLSFTKTEFDNSTQRYLMLFLIEFLQFLLCILRYKCPNWTDLERLTESVLVVELKTSLALSLTKTSRTNFLGTLCEGLKLRIDDFLGHFSTILMTLAYTNSFRNQYFSVNQWKWLERKKREN